MAAEPVPPRSGVYGRGCYKDEPWGVVAIRKRLTSVRKFYERHLEGDKDKVNPGWQPIVKATMASITLLLGMVLAYGIYASAKVYMVLRR